MPSLGSTDQALGMDVRGWHSLGTSLEKHLIAPRSDNGGRISESPSTVPSFRNSRPRISLLTSERETERASISQHPAEFPYSCVRGPAQLGDIPSTTTELPQKGTRLYGTRTPSLCAYCDLSRVQAKCMI